MYLPLTATGIVQSLAAEPKYTKEDYQRLLKYFEDDFEKIIERKICSVDVLLMLFEKHFKYVPSITMRIYDGLKREEVKEKHPDLSLYDHSKLSSAIAGCMYHYYTTEYYDKWIEKELLKDEILKVPENIEPYTLVGGDISGIQNFIYTITSKGALKSLKGRSFYLELLTEHIMSKLLYKLNLTRCNIIFSGGGRFYILSYNTQSATSAIEQVKKDINNYLFKKYGGDLVLHLETENFHPDIFQNSSNLWQNLSAKIEKSKKRKWYSNIADVIKVKMPHKDCLSRYCEVCFSEDTSLDQLVRGNENVYEAICQPCAEQFKLGEALKTISGAKHPVIYKYESEPHEFTIKIDTVYYLLAEEKDIMSSMMPKAVYRVNDLDVDNYIHPNSIFLPVGIYQHNELEDLAKVSKAYGIPRIAVLRMDVDNLGTIFSQAVPEEHRTFSRMASISRGLNDFFKYHLNIIAAGFEKNGFEEPTDIAHRGIDKQGRMLTIVYAGGDDLFLVGHWLDVTEAAFDIKKYFDKYTGNPFITISGGIAVNHDKYPIYQYAREAKKAEELAKGQRNSKDGQATKNSITLYRTQVFRWNNTDYLLERVSLFTKFLIPKEDHLAIDEKRLPKTFFYRLLALARRFNLEGVLVLPKAAYLISRARFGKDGIEETLKIKEAIMTTKKEEWKVTETAAMWVLMLTRKGGEER